MAKAKLDLSTVRERTALKPKANRTPHWQRLRPGLFLGYRPVTDGAAGNWSAQAYVDGKTRERALGSFGDLQPNERFQKAKAAAEAFMAMEESGGRAQELLVTVADACRQYVKTRDAFAEGAFKLTVYEDPIATIKLEKLRRQHLVEWRQRIEARPIRGKAGAVRAPATINREMAPLRAALRKVMAPGQPNTEAAWQEAIKPIPRKIAARRRTLYLDRQERQALLDHISEEAKPFVLALCLLPVRPGSMSNLTAASFIKKSAELVIGIDKGHEERRIHLSAAAARLMTEQAKDKLPAAPLFMQANGKAWDKNTWKVPIRQAAAAAKLDPATCAYTLRHSTITDLVVAGVATLVVAKIAGTSVEMIEKHYGHLLEDAARTALENLAI